MYFVYIFSFLALIIPLVVILVLQPKGDENVGQKVGKLLSYAILFPFMFFLGSKIGLALMGGLSYKGILSTVILGILSFKSYYNYYRSKAIWTVIQVQTLEEVIWAGLAMSFDWFILGIALSIFLNLHFFFFVGLFLCIFLIILFIREFHLIKATERWENFFKMSYLVSSTFYIFAGLFLMFMIIW